MNTDARHPINRVVSLELRGHVGIICLDDQARRNALSADLIAGVLQAISRSSDENARALVIFGANGTFCAGADIGEMRNSGWLTAGRSGHAAPTPLTLFEALESEPRLIVAAADGLVLGGGVELCLACDLALAAEDATFSLPEIGLGVIPNTAMKRLPALVGMRAAKELILTRRRLHAEEAVQLGLINRVVPRAELLEHAVSVAAAVVTGAPPGAIAAVKAGMRQATDWDAVHGLLATMRTEEWSEGFDAFLQKRKPSYEPFWKRPQ